MFAGLILEGGIISYDTNIVTGGIGARYFGLGANARYRQDRITVYLRAVSTNNGEIVKTVYVSKTILSQSLDANFFRFVKFQRLLEAETGITQSEPIQLAVKDAIEKAVHDLILEGIIDGLWSAQGGREVNQNLVNQYLEEKAAEESSKLHERLFFEKEYKNQLNVYGGVNLIDGDFSERNTGYLFGLDYRRYLNNFFDVGISAKTFRLDNGRAFRNIFGSIDLNGYFDILPNDDFGPYIYAGSGVAVDLLGPIEDFSLGEAFFKFQYGLGATYRINSRFKINAFAEQNILFTDELDGEIGGQRDDFYYNFGVGLNYSFNFKSKQKKEQIENEE